MEELENPNKKAAGGAATTAGISYQNRVAAYLLAGSLCGESVGVFRDGNIEKIGFETSLNVDDINVELSNGSFALIQVKRKLNYSTLESSDFSAVLRQFCAEEASTKKSNLHYVLVTTSDSSRKITGDLRAALDAYRLCPLKEFRRDQSRSIIELIDKTLTQLEKMVGATQAENLLKRIHVRVVDVEADSPLESATILMLRANGYIRSDLFWQKLIVDCIEHSIHRHTINVADAAITYDKFRQEKSNQTASNDPVSLFDIEMKGALPVGKECLLGTLSPEAIRTLFPDEESISSTDVFLFCFYRFDEHCNERLEFSGGFCTLQNGQKIRLIQRFATVAGAERFFAHHADMFRGQRLVIVPINSKGDFEKGLCAERHREKLERAVSENRNLLSCVHCGKAIGSSGHQLVETIGNNRVMVGPAHETCLQPDDRILGEFKSDFFDAHPALKNFDAETWFRAMQGGQGLFQSAGPRQGMKFAWGGRRPTAVPGNFIVAFDLSDGEVEYSYLRGQIHRLSKGDAEKFAKEMTLNVRQAREGSDPLCYSDQSKAFGTKSVLLQRLGVSEKLRAVVRARVVLYNQAVADRYHQWENWYAPLIYLREADSGDVIFIENKVPLLSDPLTVDRSLESWHSSGVVIPTYELAILSSDSQFDDFVEGVFAEGREIILDPLFGKTNGGNHQLVSGTEIFPLSKAEQSG